MVRLHPCVKNFLKTIFMCCGMQSFHCRNFLLYLWWVVVFRSGKSHYLTRQNLYCTLTSFRLLVMYALHPVTALYFYSQVLLLRRLYFFSVVRSWCASWEIPGNDQLPDVAVTQLHSWNLCCCHQDNPQQVSNFDCMKLALQGLWIPLLTCVLFPGHPKQLQLPLKCSCCSCLGTRTSKVSECVLLITALTWPVC